MNRHTTDFTSLIFGSVFVAIVASWLLAKLVEINLPSAGWFFAGAFVLLGLLGLTAGLWPGRQPHQKS